MRLLNLYYNFTLTKKVKQVSGILICFTACVLLLQSDILEQSSNLIHNRTILVTTFLYEAFNIIKIMFVLYSMLLCIYVFHLNRFDVFIVTRKTRIKVILSKVIVVLLLEILFVLYLFTIFVILWGLLDTSITYQMIITQLYHLIVLSSYYTLLYIFLIMFFSSIFIVIIPFIGYLVSNFSIDYGMSVNELSSNSKIIHLFFPDLILFNKEIYYIYSIWFVIDISIAILVLIIIKYKVDDIII